MPRTRRCRSALAASGVLLLLAVSACAGRGDADLADVEQKLTERYLQPLAAAGLNVRTQDTCRLDLIFPPDPVWRAQHLQASYIVEAPVDEVADVLDEEGIRLVRDRDPMIVQQEPGDPQGGWNGGLARQAGDRTSLVLTYNNVDVDSLAASGGWGEACP